jgi:hypothetical protein
MPRHATSGARKEFIWLHQNMGAKRQSFFYIRTITLGAKSRDTQIRNRTLSAKRFDTQIRNWSPGVLKRVSLLQALPVYLFECAPARWKRCFKKHGFVIANLAGSWNSDLNVEVFDIKWDGTAKKEGSRIPERHESARFFSNLEPCT